KTNSLPLRLSPCSAVAFLRALSVRLRTPLLDDIHCELLKRLTPNLRGRGPKVSWSRSKEAYKELDWKYLDQVTWPVFFVEFARAREAQKRAEEIREEREEESGDENSDSSDSDSGEGGGSGRKSGPGSESADGEDGEGAEGLGGGGRGGGKGRGGRPEPGRVELLCLALEAGEHHLLPLELKVEALEYLCEQVLETAWFEKEAEHRLRSPPESFVVDNDGTVFDCIVCGLHGNLLCCDACPRAYHAKCIGGKHGTDGDNWACFECSLKDPTPDGLRVPRVNTRLGPVWVVASFVFRPAQSRGWMHLPPKSEQAPPATTSGAAAG
ncbi:unnamed protein product, partial [Discosporangium mesarthrocarpum]